VRTPQPTSTRPPYGQLKAVATEYGFKYSSFRYAVANGLPHWRVGRAIYVRYVDVERWLASRMEHAS
jgi:hypothetical protein